MIFMIKDSNINYYKKQKKKEIIHMEIKKGQIVDGTVTGIKPYGAFIEIDKGPVGLAFIEDLSVVRIKWLNKKLNAQLT